MTTIGDEFDGSALGDERLDARLLLTVEALAGDPELSFPEGLGDGSALLGTYRRLSNPAVRPETILRPHIMAAAGRVGRHHRVLVVDDTTEFAPTGKLLREGIGANGHFWGHFSLAVTADGHREPLGLLAL